MRIDRMAQGNFGWIENLGEGLSEMKIDYGPGYRIYFVQRGSDIVILLCGGDKSSQNRDIRAAKVIAKELNI
jgi:putative addiction module killer protein